MNWLLKVKRFLKRERKRERELCVRDTKEKRSSPLFLSLSSHRSFTFSPSVLCLFFFSFSLWRSFFVFIIDGIRICWCFDKESIMATYIHCLETCVNLTFDPGIRIWSIRTRENNNRVVVLPDALFFPGDLAQKFSRSKRLSPSACRRITNRSFLQRETLADFSILRLTDVEHMKCHGNTDNRSKIWS